eukprot:g2483.t1
MNAVFGVVGRLLMREALGEDVQLITELGAAGYISKVALPPLGDLMFEGEECATEEAAQTAALRICLEAFASASDIARDGLGSPGATWASVGPVFRLQEPTPKRVAKQDAEPMPVGRVGRLHLPRPKVKVKAMPKPNEQVAAEDSKTQLHTALSRMIGRSVMKADLGYVIYPVPEGEGGKRSTQPSGNGAGTGSQTARFGFWQDVGGLPAGPVPGAQTPGHNSRKRRRISDADDDVLEAKVMRTTSSASIQVQEGLEFATEWRDLRLEPCSEAEVEDGRDNALASPRGASRKMSCQDPASIEYYFGQVCLVCQAVVSVKGWVSHATGKKHCQRLFQQPMKLRADVQRPLPTLLSKRLGNCQEMLHVKAQEKICPQRARRLTVGERRSF